MKTFEEYADGEWVVYKNPHSDWHLMSFQAFKSQWTHNAFRLKYGDRQVVADISEIAPISEMNKLVQEQYENAHSNLRRNSDGKQSAKEEY